MKRKVASITALVALVVFIGCGGPRTPDTTTQTPEQRTEHAQAMLQDSAAMRVLIPQAAAHPQWRREMAQALVQQAGRDTTFRAEMIRMYTTDAQLRQSFQNALGGAGAAGDTTRRTGATMPGDTARRTPIGQQRPGNR